MKQYPNGARLLQIAEAGTQAVTVLFLFGVGSRFESKEINGASHFLEHLMFKGTRRRPTSLAISAELDRVGAEFNAMTAKDYTGYYIKIAAAHGSLAVDVLSDMLLRSLFAPKEINRERGVIVEEINMYKDNPLMNIESVFEQSVFAGHALARDVAGPASVIRGVSRQSLLEYRDRYYSADNLVVAVAGKFTSALVRELEHKFILKMKAKRPFKDLRPVAMNQSVPRVKIEWKKTKQAQAALGFPSYGYGDERIYALHLLSIILGGNMSSRLFIAVREQRGLCYFVRCYPNFYQGAGNVLVQAGLDSGRLEEALGIIARELRKIKKSGVSAKELADARDFLNGKIVLTLEDSSQLAEYYAKQAILTGENLSPEEKMKKYAAVTPADIKTVARDVFRAQRANLALIGPFKDKNKYNALLKNI